MGANSPKLDPVETAAAALGGTVAYQIETQTFRTDKLKELYEEVRHSPELCTAVQAELKKRYRDLFGKDPEGEGEEYVTAIKFFKPSRNGHGKKKRVA